MKLNFFNLLARNETDAEAIAQEIVLLEQRIAEGRAEEQRLKEISHDMRAKQLCGEAISASVIRKIKDQLNQIEEDLLVLGDSLGKLTVKLTQALIEQNKQGWEQWRQDKDNLHQEEKTLAIEIIKLKTRANVLEGLLSDGARGILTTPELSQIANAQRQEFLKSLASPTCSDNFSELERRHIELKNFNVQNDMVWLLDKYREVGAVHV